MATKVVEGSAKEENDLEVISFGDHPTPCFFEFNRDFNYKIMCSIENLEGANINDDQKDAEPEEGIVWDYDRCCDYFAWCEEKESKYLLHLRRIDGGKITKVYDEKIHDVKYWAGGYYLAIAFGGRVEILRMTLMRDKSFKILKSVALKQLGSNKGTYKLVWTTSFYTLLIYCGNEMAYIKDFDERFLRPIYYDFAKKATTLILSGDKQHLFWCSDDGKMQKYYIAADKIEPSGTIVTPHNGRNVNFGISLFGYIITGCRNPAEVKIWCANNLICLRSLSFTTDFSIYFRRFEYKMLLYKPKEGGEAYMIEIGQEFISNKWARYFESLHKIVDLPKNIVLFDVKKDDTICKIFYKPFGSPPCLSCEKIQFPGIKLTFDAVKYVSKTIRNDFSNEKYIKVGTTPPSGKELNNKNIATSPCDGKMEKIQNGQVLGATANDELLCRLSEEMDSLKNEVKSMKVILLKKDETDGKLNDSFERIELAFNSFLEASKKSNYEKLENSDFGDLESALIAAFKECLQNELLKKMNKFIDQGKDENLLADIKMKVRQGLPKKIENFKKNIRKNIRTALLKCEVMFDIEDIFEDWSQSDNSNVALIDRNRSTKIFFNSLKSDVLKNVNDFIENITI